MTTTQKALFVTTMLLPFPLALMLVRLNVPNLELYLGLFAAGVWGSAWICRKEKDRKATVKMG
ncbi:hypothetical protein [Geobacter anodireducens]